MPLLRTTISLVLFLYLGIDISFARSQDETYAETRELLLQLQRSSGNKALKKLFEEGDERMADLIRALYDHEHKVNLNSQVIIKYLAPPKGLAALEEWYAHRKTQGKGYWYPPIELLSEDKVLDDKGVDPAKLVLMNLHPAKDCHAKMIAYNKSLDTVLIEVIYGEVFTEGWHVVLKRERQVASGFKQPCLAIVTEHMAMTIDQQPAGQKYEKTRVHQTDDGGDVNHGNFGQTRHRRE